MGLFTLSDGRCWFHHVAARAPITLMARREGRACMDLVRTHRRRPPSGLACSCICHQWSEASARLPPAGVVRHNGDERHQGGSRDGEAYEDLVDAAEGGERGTPYFRAHGHGAFLSISHRSAGHRDTRHAALIRLLLSGRATHGAIPRLGQVRMRGRRMVLLCLYVVARIDCRNQCTQPWRVQYLMRSLSVPPARTQERGTWRASAC